MILEQGHPRAARCNFKPDVLEDMQRACRWLVKSSSLYLLEVYDSAHMRSKVYVRSASAVSDRMLPPQEFTPPAHPHRVRPTTSLAAKFPSPWFLVEDEPGPGAGGGARKGS